MAVLKIIEGIMTNPAIILGLVALLGLLLQGKSTADIIKGTIKTILGLLVLSAGSGLIVTSLSPFADMFAKAFNLNGIVPFDEAVIGAVIAEVKVVALCTSFVMAFGFVINVILARITPFKYIYLTGHMIWVMAGAISWALYDLGLSQVYIIVFGSILQGMLCIILPAIAQPIMRKLTGNNSIAYAHLTTIGCVTSACAGKLLGNKEHDAEDMKLPEGLSFFRDTAISVSLVMVVIYVITAIFAGSEYVSGLDAAAGQNYIIFSILQGLGFAAGVLVLLQGVRMFLGEIVPAFRGIANKLVPGAIPALDCPVVFQYGPNSLMLGFIFSVIGMLVGMTVSIALGLVVPLPSVIGGFFTGGVSGIFGNAVGGRRGAMVSGFVYGIILTIPVALFYPLYDLPSYGVIGIALLCPDALIVLALIKLAFVTGLPLPSFIVAVALFGFFCWKKSNSNNNSKEASAV